MYPNQFGGSNLFGKTLSSTRKINWSSLLDGTQKTLGVINQALPLIYQVKPIIDNAKTMFKIADVIKSQDVSNTNVKQNNVVNYQSNNRPIFYI